MKNAGPNVSQGEFLVLLLVIQAQNNPPQWLVINGAREIAHRLVYVFPERHDLIERGAEKEGAASFPESLPRASCNSC